MYGRRKFSRLEVSGLKSGFGSGLGSGFRAWLPPPHLAQQPLGEHDARQELRCARLPVADQRHDAVLRPGARLPLDGLHAWPVCLS